MDFGNCSKKRQGLLFDFAGYLPETRDTQAVTRFLTLGVFMSFDWGIAGWSDKKQTLTTWRDGRSRYEDFTLTKDGSGVDATKHFGDHEYESGTTISLAELGLPAGINPAIALLYAAVQFHEEKLNF